MEPGLAHFPARKGFTFHDLRHTFGTLAVRVFSLVDVQAYMGHADIQMTMRYAHHVPKRDAARRFTEAIRAERSEDFDRDRSPVDEQRHNRSHGNEPKDGSPALGSASTAVSG